MIFLKDISVIFNENIALRKINLTIAAGDFITIVGGNGAGKSTLLNVLTGRILATSGKLYFDERDITSYSSYKRASFISHVFQDPQLGTCNDLTLAENLALALNRGKKRTLKLALSSNLYKFFEELVANLELGLEKRLKDSISLLSGGQRQAASLLMATLQPCKLLLLDEHTASLDPSTTNLILKLTQEIVEKDKITTMMVTHNMHSAVNFGNRTIVMRQGEIMEELNNENRLKLLNYSTHDIF